MNITLIIDLVLLAIILIFTLVGLARGLFRSIMYLVKNIIALVGAAYLSKIFEPKVTEMVYPLFKRKMVNKVIELLPQAPESLKLPELNLDFSGMGLDIPAITEFIQKIKVTTNQSALAASNKIYGELTEMIESSASSLLSTAVRAVLFLGFFFLLLIFVGILVRLVDDFLELPVLKTFNKLGGALFGLVSGLLFVYLLTYVGELIGMGWLSDKAEGTILLSFFINHSPLEAINFLKVKVGSVTELIE